MAEAPPGLAAASTLFSARTPGHLERWQVGFGGFGWRVHLFNGWLVGLVGWQILWMPLFDFIYFLHVFRCFFFFYIVLLFSLGMISPVD